MFACNGKTTTKTCLLHIYTIHQLWTQDSNQYNCIIVIIRWKLCLTIFQSMKCTLHPSLSHVWYQGHCSLTEEVGNPKRHTTGESCQTRWGISNSPTLHVHYLLTESTMLHGYLIMMIFNQFNLALAVLTTCNEFFLNPKFFLHLEKGVKDVHERSPVKENNQ